MSTRLISLFAVACVALVGCELFSSDSDEFDSDVDFNIPDGSFDPNNPLGPNGLPISGEGVGGSCSGDSDCRLGLGCGGGVCEAQGNASTGDLCTVSAECGEGLACGITATCTESAGLEEGAQCSDITDCGPGLRCNVVGLTGLCQPEGTGDAGMDCASNSDCLDPLGCSQAGTCLIPGFGGVSLLPPRECAEPNAGDTFRAFFEIPDADGPGEFYRLPFPNDARFVDGQLNLDGYHNPGLNVLGGELIDVYLAALEAEATGFPTNPTVFFRFSEPIEFDTVQGGEEATLFMVNITPDSPDYGRGMSMSWVMTTGRGNFICNNYLAIRPSWRSPLRHGETYAAWLTDGVRSSEGDVPVADADFAAVLRSSRPDGPRTGDAWDAYQPLRDYFTDQDISTANIIAGTVFTTMDPDENVPGIREAVRAETAPALENLAVCDDGDTSPCAGEERGCIDASGDFIQVHATYDAPIFQAGTRPYLMPEDGGNLEFNGGTAVVQGREDICVSMTIPTADMPEDGWPVVMYGHGTGGDFTSHIADGTAGRLANATTADGREVNFVSVSIDGSQHGPRRGDSDLEPEPLFFNFANPNAAIGNTLQGAADYFVLTHVLENVNLAAGDSPTGDDLFFDPTAMYYFGHSQGATVGAPFVAYEEAVRAVVFSGAGGGLTLSLLNKTEPVDIASGVNTVLNEGGAVSDNHPFLNLLQWWIEPVESLNYGRLYYREPAGGLAGLHVFQSYGGDDSYSPEPTLEAFGGSIELQLAENSPIEVRLPTVEYPVSGNRTSNGEPVTAVMVAYQPNGYDGHFVIFRDANGQRQSMEFLASDYLDGIPTVSE